MTVRVLASIPCVLLCLLSACKAGSPPLEGQTLAGQFISGEVLTRGAQVYRESCESCHGATGAGDGPKSVGMQPPPRDLRQGLYKFASVAAGEMPTDADLLRTIRRGLQGTAMAPSNLDEGDASAVVHYIKTFSKRWLHEAPGMVYRPSVDFSTSAKRLALYPKEEWVARGAQLYHVQGKCWTCHPAYETKANIYEWSMRRAADFPGDLYQAKWSVGGYGGKLLAPDFLRDTLRTGTSEEALFRVISAGVGGTNMQPAQLDEERVWYLVYYLRSLIELKDSGKAEELRKSLEAQMNWQPGD